MPATGDILLFIAGGEPLLIRDLLERIASFRDSSFLFYTNGTLLPPYVPILKKAKNIMPVISVEGGDPYTGRQRRCSS